MLPSPLPSPPLALPFPSRSNSRSSSQTHAALALARVGTVVREKWRLDRLLGVGGMAAVFAAMHRNGNRVAIKMLHRDLADVGELRSRFLREGYLANAVEHPGAVSVLDDDVTPDGTVFLVMELLEGETLEQRWERHERRLPVLDVLSAMDGLLDVLAAAHAKGLVHRDVKPENVFLTEGGGLKVLDFGIARLGGAGGRSRGLYATQAGATMGTPAFMPPEQARGHWTDVDARSDLWAVGASMFALLAGRYVHQAPTLADHLLYAMTRQAPPLRTVLPGVAAEVEAVVDRALAYRREERWQDARSMQVAVRKAMTAVRDSRDAASGWRIATPVAFRRVEPVRGAKVDELSFDDAATEVRMEPPETERSTSKERSRLARRGGIAVALVALAATVAVCEAAPRGRSARGPSAGPAAVAVVSSSAALTTATPDEPLRGIAPAPPATGVPEALSPPPSGLQGRRPRASAP